MPRRCSTCSTARTVRHRTDPDRCIVCDLLDEAETKDAAARALHELFIGTEKLESRADHVLATASALQLAIEALEDQARSIRYVARCVSRTLEPHRRRAAKART